MASPVRTRLTLEEFRALPEQKPYLEFWNGEIVQKMAPQRHHALLQVRFATLLDAYGARQQGTTMTEASIEFLVEGDTRELIPDVAYWAPGKPVGGPVMQPPTLAVEIRSAGQSLGSLQGKCQYYVRNGVDEAWIVDPEARTVLVYRAGHAQASTHSEPAVIDSRNLPGLSIELRQLFAVLDA